MSTLLILAAVSGTGKSTVGAQLRARNLKLKLSVSHTTRSPRSGEENGVDYHFISRADFEEMVGTGQFAEWAEYVGNCYGTARSTVDAAAQRNEDLFFDIEMLGARQLKAAYPDALTVFLLPPSLGELRRRLRDRGTDDAETIARRLQRGRQELLAAQDFDYLVINDDLARAVDDLEAIYRGTNRDRHKHRDHLQALIEEQNEA